MTTGVAAANRAPAPSLPRFMVPMLGITAGIQTLDPMIATVALVGVGLEDTRVLRCHAGARVRHLYPGAGRHGDPHRPAGRPARPSAGTDGRAGSGGPWRRGSGAQHGPVDVPQWPGGRRGRAWRGVRRDVAFAFVAAVGSERLGAALGLFGAMVGITTLGGAFLGGVLASVNWRIAFAVVPVLCVITFVLTPRFTPVARG